MTLIDLEFDRDYFIQLIAAGLAFGPVVPFPTLESPTTTGRLISRVDWLDLPVIDPGGVPGYTPPLGVLLLRVAVRINHLGVDELRADPLAAGITVQGHVWMSVTLTAGVLTVAVVAFGADGLSPVVLPRPNPVIELKVPGLPVPVMRTAVVADTSLIALRFATTALDDPTLPPGHALDARPGTMWILHVPAQVFIDMVVGPLGSSLANSREVTVEEAPRGRWTQVEDDKWGVAVTAVVEKQDACPGVFSDVDVSINLSATLSLSVGDVPGSRKDEKQLELVLAQAANASDWDAFRCFLGSGGIVGAAVSLLNPVLGFGVGLGSLVGLSEAIRIQTGKAFREETSSIGHFPGVTLTQVGVSTGWAQYTGAMQLPTVAIRGSLERTWEVGPHGLDAFAVGLILIPTNKRRFNPESGEIRDGTWEQRINCSLRTLDQKFTYRDITVSDDRVFAGAVLESLLVSLWETSIAEPMGWGAIQELGLNTFRVRASPAHRGAGWLLLHTTAGLRVFTLTPVPPPPDILRNIHPVIEKFCDAQHQLERVVHVQELKWVTPPPEYHLEFEPLRQWQIVLGALTPETTVAVSASGGDRVLLERADFAGDNRRAVAQLVTDARTELVLTTGGDDAPTAAVVYRWLMPVKRIKLPGGVRSFTVADDVIELHAHRGTVAHVDTSTFRVIESQGGVQRGAGAAASWRARGAFRHPRRGPGDRAPRGCARRRNCGSDTERWIRRVVPPTSLHTLQGLGKRIRRTGGVLKS
jgi:hypothetical protein